MNMRNPACTPTAPHNLSNETHKLSSFVGVFLILILISTVLISGRLLYQAGIKDWNNDLYNLSTALSESAAQSLSSAHLVLDSMQADIEEVSAENDQQLKERIATKQFSETLREKIRGLPFISGVGVSSAHGKVLVLSRSFPAPEIDMSDRDYYRFHIESASTQDYLGRTINARSNGMPTFFLTRRINDRNGNLLAIIVVGLRSSFFEEFFKKLAEQKPFSIVLSRNDNTSLVWWDARTETDQQRGTLPLHLLHPERPQNNTYSAAFTFKKAQWLGVQHPVRGMPLNLSVAVTDEVYFAEWLQTMYPVMIVSAIGLIGLVGGYLVVIRQARQHEMDAELATRLKDEANKANDSKSRFLAMVSHEIRTPMNGILGLSELLVDSELPEKHRRYAESIHHTTEGLVHIINDILDLSRIESGKLDLEAVPFNPERLTQQLVDLFRPLAEKKSLPLETNINCNPELQIIGDPSRLKQVLSNLLGNAIKFTEAGCIRLSLTVSAVENKEDECNLTFKIFDTGIGIEPAGLERLFQPFSQADRSIARRFGGTGLGLTISKHLVELMGGGIKCQSRPGQFTEFSFDLPKLRKVTASSNRADTIDPGSGTLSTDKNSNSGLDGIRILIAEDTEINRQLLRILLSRRGCHLVEAENGFQAIDAIHREKFDLILMDCMMPLMDGYEATALIRQYERDHQFPRTPIIALTANAIDGDRQHCLDAGMDDYLSKPFSQSDLMGILNRWLKSHN